MLRVIFIIGFWGWSLSCFSGTLVSFTPKDGIVPMWSDPYYRGTAILISADTEDDTPSPCFSPTWDGSPCSQIGFAVYNNRNDGPSRYSMTLLSIGGVFQNMNKDRDVIAAKTMGDLMKLYLSRKNNLGVPMLVNDSGGAYCDYLGSISKYCVNKRRSYGDLCVAFAYNSQGGAHSAVLFPGANCISPTDPGNQCDIEGQAVLDHGTLSDESVDGHRATQTLRVSCIKPTSAMVYLQSNNGGGKIKLRPDGSLYSSLTVDGNNGVNGTQVAIPSGGANIVFDSTLSKVGSLTPGPFEGSAVAIVNFL